VTYDGSRWVLRGIDLRIMRGEKIALVGYNGYGKTTLLRMLAGNLPLSEGKRVLGHKVAIGYQSQDFAETMDPGRTVFDTVKSAASDSTELEVRTLLGGFGFPGDSIEKTVGVLSGGEKIRLAFARLLLNPPNFLILDEPTTHLDIQSCEALERALESYQGTICLVSHDIDFVRRVAGGIIAMTPPGITRYAGGYDYYREKVSPAVETGGPAVAAAGAAPAVAASAQTADRKELRRQRALLRQRRHERSRDLKKDVQRIERQIDVYEKERDAILLQLSGDPSTVDFGGLSARLGFIEDELRRYADRWEQAALAVERAVSGEDSAAPGQGDE
jgi:ATP-binding cassette subfamily F protein 3